MVVSADAVHHVAHAFCPQAKRQHLWNITKYLHLACKRMQWSPQLQRKKVLTLRDQHPGFSTDDQSLA
jgi:hypothetical protein